jgi:hypothetical protein
MATNDNPAGRLYGLLSELRNQDGALPAWQGWAAVLDTASPEATFEQYAAVPQLPDQIRAQLDRANPKDIPALTSELDNIKNVLSDFSMFGSQLVNTLQRIPDACLAQLNAVSSVLTTLLGTEELSDEIQGQIRDQITTLLEEIGQAADLDDELRLFLADHLHGMLRGLSAFKITGLEPLRRSVDQTIGAWMVQHPEVRSVKDEELTSRFWEVVKRIGAVIMIGNSAYTLVAHIDPAIATHTPAPIVLELPTASDPDTAN